MREEIIVLISFIIVLILELLISLGIIAAAIYVAVWMLRYLGVL